MKNIPADNENNLSYTNNYDQVTDNLLKSKGGHSLLECNKVLVKSYDVIDSEPMGHKSRCSHRTLLKNNVSHESRSQSLPNSLESKNKTNGYTSDSCDTQLKLLPESETPPESPTQEFWFKTWPERNKNIENDNDTSVTSSSSSKVCDNTVRSEQNGKQNTFTLNEALQSISLAYSPVTKQLHYVEKNESEPVVEDVVESKVKLGHRRTEAGSFSSTVSSLSDPSPSGSLLDADERTSSPDSTTKPKKKGLSSFFNR